MNSATERKITIAIPTFNRTRYLHKALQSVREQNYTNYEILIGDSSASDRVQKIIEKIQDPRIRYIKFSEEIEQPVKFNELLSAATGEWMVFLCDDDWIDPKYLPHLTSYLNRYPHATLVRSRFRLVDEAGKFIRLDGRSKEYMPSAEFLSNLFLPEHKFFKMNISGIMFRREVLREEGGFKHFPTSWHTDQIAWALLGLRGGCIYVDEPLCSIRLHGGSLTSSFRDNLENSVQTNLLARAVFRSILDRLSISITEGDMPYLELARTRLEQYMSRHLTRSFDRGFLTVLSSRQNHIPQKMQGLFNRMKELEVPFFRSAPLYPLIGFLPKKVRKPIVDRVKEFKVYKWCA